MGAGAGSVNFWASRKIAANRPRRAADVDPVGGLLGGAERRGRSGMPARWRRASTRGSGIRLLSLAAGARCRG